jgi:hypothetical protein
MIGMDFGDGLGYGRTWDDGSPVGIHREAVRILESWAKSTDREFTTDDTPINTDVSFYR